MWFRSRSGLYEEGVLGQSPLVNDDRVEHEDAAFDEVLIKGEDEAEVELQLGLG